MNMEAAVGVPMICLDSATPARDEFNGVIVMLTGTRASPGGKRICVPFGRSDPSVGTPVIFPP